MLFLLGVALAQDPATLPGRQCAAFILETVPLYEGVSGGRVASPDRPEPGPTTSRAPTERLADRPSERVASEKGGERGALVSIAPVLAPGTMASLPDGWTPIGGGPAVVPTGMVGNTQYYEVRNYVIACEALETVTPLPAVSLGK